MWEGTKGDVDTSFDPPNWVHPDIIGLSAEGRGTDLVLTVFFD